MSKPRHRDSAGPSQRQLRVGEVLRRRLAEVLARGDVHDPRLQSVSVTVAEVRASPDLKVATAYVMPLGGDRREETMAALRENRAEIRHLVARGLELKFAPELRFELDETFDRIDETRRLFSEDRVKRDVDGD